MDIRQTPEMPLPTLDGHHLCDPRTGTGLSTIYSQISDHSRTDQILYQTPISSGPRYQAYTSSKSFISGQAGHTPLNDYKPVLYQVFRLAILTNTRKMQTPFRFFLHHASLPSFFRVTLGRVPVSGATFHRRGHQLHPFVGFHGKPPFRVLCRSHQAAA
jgi:hypothetical protein